MYANTKGHKSPVPVLAPEKTKGTVTQSEDLIRARKRLNGKTGNKTGRTVTLSCKGYREVTVGN